MDNNPIVLLIRQGVYYAYRIARASIASGSPKDNLWELRENHQYGTEGGLQDGFEFATSNL